MLDSSRDEHGSPVVARDLRQRITRDDTTRAGMPTAIARAATLSRTTAPAPMTAPSPIVDAVEDLRARAQPGAVADRDAGRRARLLEHRLRRIGEVVVAADDVAVRGHQRVARRCVTRLAENTSQLKPMFAPSPSSMSPFLHDRIVLRPMNTPLPIAMPRLRLALRVEQAVVVDRRRCRRCGSCADGAARRSGRRRRCARRRRAAADTAPCAAPGPSAPGTHCDEQLHELVADQQRRQPGAADDRARCTSRAPTCRGANSWSCARGMPGRSAASSEPSLLAIPRQRAPDARRAGRPRGA